MQAPINYFGGKGTQLNMILSQFPQKDTWDKYLEPYGGSGVVLLNKPKVDIEIWNDLHCELFHLYTVLQDKALFEELKYRLDLTYYHESVRDYVENLEAKTPVDIAYKFFVFNRMSYNGTGGFSQSISVVRKNMTKSVRDLLASIEGLEEFHQRWSSVFVYNRDALELIEKFDKEGFMYYLDPPYIKSTRKSEHGYVIDQDDKHHEILVEKLLNIKNAKVLLSGYDNEIYNPLIKNGWFLYQYKSPNSESIEYLWRNYSL